MRNCHFDKIEDKENLKSLIKDTTYFINYVTKIFDYNKKELSEKSIYTKILYIDIIYKLEELREELHYIYNLIDNTTVEKLLKNK